MVSGEGFFPKFRYCLETWMNFSEAYRAENSFSSLMASNFFLAILTTGKGGGAVDPVK